MTVEISALASVDGSRRVTKRVLAILAPAADDVVAALEHLDHRRDVVRIVLQIAVGRHDQPAARVREAGGEGRGLSEIAAEADHAQVRIARLQPRQDLEALVRAAIVDDDDLVASAPRPPACR